MATNFDPSKYDWNAGYKQAQNLMSAKKSFYYSKTDAQRQAAAKKAADARAQLTSMGTPNELIIGKGNNYSQYAKDYLSKFRTYSSAGQQSSAATPYQPYSAPTAWGQDVDPRATTNWTQADKLNKSLLQAKMTMANDPQAYAKKLKEIQDQAHTDGISNEYLMQDGSLGQMQDWMKKFTYAADQWQGQPNQDAGSWTQQQANNATDAATNLNNPMWDSFKQSAAMQGKAAYNEQVANYQKLMSQLQNQANQSMDAVNNNVKDATQKLEDTSFQDYLKSRQAMTNRGVANTGLAEDANTRLGLDRTRQLAGIQRDANAQAYKIQDNLNTQQTDAMTKMAQTNMQDMIDKLFQEYYKTGSKNALDAAKQYQTMLKDMMPYQQMTKEQEGKFALDTAKQQLAQLQADRDYSVKLSDQMGYLVGMDGQPLKDANGNLISTVEKQKLDEIIRNNTFNNQVDWTKVQEEIRNNQANNQLDAAKLAEVIRNNTFNNQVDWTKVQETIRNNMFNNELDAKKLEEIIRNNTFNNKIDWAKVQEEIRNNMFNNKLGEGKLNETIRHNQASEDLKQQSINLDGQELQAKIVQWGEENRLDARKLDISEQSLAAKIDYDRAMIDLGRDRLISQKDKNQADAIATQMGHVAKQLQKKGISKGSKKKLTDQYNALAKKLGKVYAGAKLKDSGSYGGDPYSGASSSGSGSFGGFRKLGKEPATFKSHLSQAIARGGIPKSEAKYMTELVGRESSWNPRIKNPTSTAHGYGQFLNSTEREYKRKYPNLSYSNPVDQLILMYHYVKDRYGTAKKALQKWESRSPHWY
jgi:hypothetical protein